MSKPLPLPRYVEVEKVREKLFKKADLYEKDGEPGPRGYNCWGWRIIAEMLRKVAEEL